MPLFTTVAVRLPERTYISQQSVSHGGLKDPIYLSDSHSLRDQLKGQTTEHAEPPRFEDEGQSGG